MCFCVKDWWAMMILRGLNGACLAGMLPIANSIVADRFDDAVRGRMFTLLMMSRGLGAALFGAIYSITSEWCPLEGRLASCEQPDPDGGCSALIPPCTCSGMLGWQIS